MGREIKFRAWDKRGNRMLTVNEPEEQGKREYYPFEVCIGFSSWNKQDIILMQWTGLKDRDAKEIYESDILYAISPSIGNMFVVFEDASYVLYNKFGKWGLLSRLVELSSEEKGFHVEVIGNIYEHPELI